MVVLNTLLYPDGAAARLFWPSGSLFQRPRTVLTARQAPLAAKCMILAAQVRWLHPFVFHRRAVALTMQMGVVRRLEPGVADRFGLPFATAEGRRALAKTLAPDSYQRSKEEAGPGGPAPESSEEDSSEARLPPRP